MDYNLLHITLIYLKKITKMKTYKIKLHKEDAFYEDREEIEWKEFVKVDNSDWYKFKNNEDAINYLSGRDVADNNIDFYFLDITTITELKDD